MLHVALLGLAVPVLHTDDGLRAVGRDQDPVVPASVQEYVASEFGVALPAVWHAMEVLEESQEPEALAEEGFL